MEKQLTLNSQISSVCNDDYRCLTCKGVEEPSIVVLSNLPQEKSFIQLICKSCLICKPTISEIQQKLTLESTRANTLEEGDANNKMQSSQLEHTKKEQEDQKNISNSDLPHKQEEKSVQSDNQTEEINRDGQEEKDQEKECLKNKDERSENKEKEENIQEVKNEPSFLLKPNHVQFQYEDFIKQLDSSLKRYKFELLHKSQGLQLYLKEALRVIYDIQSEVENMTESINKASSRAEQIIFDLKKADNIIEKDQILKEITQHIKLKKNEVEVQIQQYEFTKKIQDIQSKLEFLSESLQPQIFELSSQLYIIKKETLEQCNKILIELNIQKRWKQYSDISMNQECMSSGMRGVYRFSISQDGQISRGTNTGYVYLGRDTTENYVQYEFVNLTPLPNSSYNTYGWGSDITKSERADDLANYFLSQRERILRLQQQISYISK